MKETNVKYVAKKAIGCTDTVKAARELLEGWARGDYVLWQSLTEKYISRACVDAIKAVTTKKRKVAWKGEQPSTSDRLKLSAETLALYSFKLPSGKILGDASHYDLQTAGRAFERQANSFQEQKSQASRNSLWMYALAGRMRGSKATGKIVRNVMSEEELGRLRARF